MSTDFHALIERSIRNLSEFLHTEVDLGITFAEMAETQRRQGNAERYETSKRNANSTLEVIDRFMDRLPADLRIEMEARRAKLAQLMSSL